MGAIQNQAGTSTAISTLNRSASIAVGFSDVLEARDGKDNYVVVHHSYSEHIKQGAVLTVQNGNNTLKLTPKVIKGETAVRSPKCIKLSAHNLAKLGIMVNPTNATAYGLDVKLTLSEDYVEAAKVVPVKPIKTEAVKVVSKDEAVSDKHVVVKRKRVVKPKHFKALLLYPLGLCKEEEEIEDLIRLRPAVMKGFDRDEVAALVNLSTGQVAYGRVRGIMNADSIQHDCAFRASYNLRKSIDTRKGDSYEVRKLSRKERIKLKLDDSNYGFQAYLVGVVGIAIAIISNIKF